MVVCTLKPVPRFFAETVAPGIDFPCASVMVPESVAPDTCAYMGTENRRPRITLKARNRITFDFMDNSLPVFEWCEHTKHWTLSPNQPLLKL